GTSTSTSPCTSSSSTSPSSASDPSPSLFLKPWLIPSGKPKTFPIQDVLLSSFSFSSSSQQNILSSRLCSTPNSICKPLHYGTLLGSRACVHMAAAAWATGFLHALLHTANTFSLPLYHGNTMDQFFCEAPQILKFSCSDICLRELGLIMISVLAAFVCFVFIVLSRVQISRAVLSCEQGRHKAFSTCLPHLAVVSLMVSTAVLSHPKPHSVSSPGLDMAVSVLYSVVPPAVNPLIYSMRNQEIKDALRKLMTGYFS
ncbi:olfactory receptor 14J1-like, partial [Patagioenas fasciata]|uniref:olfactory receptor 14J1-like n=1 Tax=Patagioenas fasciata TaxID=372321 RepID=UPI003A99198C